MSEAKYLVHLTESYSFEGEQTTEIPADGVTDYGGMWMVEATDGSSRAFSKQEVAGIEEIDDE